MGDSSVKWKAFGLTHVEYIEGDLVGLFLAVCTLAPVFIVVGFVTHIYFRREIHTITFFIGQLLNEILNLILKKVTKEPRPLSHHSGLKPEFEYGFPSAHSQFVWFFVSYMCLFLFLRCQSNSGKPDIIWRCLSSLILIAGGLTVSFSRLYLVYHTMRQVIWGGCIGGINGVIWFIICHFLLTPYYPTVTGWKISEMFLIRDSTLIPNIMWFEYTSSRQESRSRLRKMQ